MAFLRIFRNNKRSIINGLGSQGDVNARLDPSFDAPDIGLGFNGGNFENAMR